MNVPAQRGQCRTDSSLLSDGGDDRRPDDAAEQVVAKDVIVG
jgi:hypothetical protein